MIVLTDAKRGHDVLLLDSEVVLYPALSQSSRPYQISVQSDTEWRTSSIEFRPKSVRL